MLIFLKEYLNLYRKDKHGQLKSDFAYHTCKRKTKDWTDVRVSFPMQLPFRTELKMEHTNILIIFFYLLLHRNILLPSQFERTSMHFIVSTLFFRIIIARNHSYPWRQQYNRGDAEISINILLRFEIRFLFWLKTCLIFCLIVLQICIATPLCSGLV